MVEFGIIAILFTLIMFAIADFGLLLNDWLSVSSGARLLARDAAVGMFQTDLVAEASTLKIPGVTADPHFLGSYCCNVGSPGSALQLQVKFYDECSTPDVGGCTTVDVTKLDQRFGTGPFKGTCTANCAHPAAPSATGTCDPAQPLKPCPGDTVVVTLIAAGAQVVTPLVRPFFNSPGVCPDSTTPSHCYVTVSSSVAMRFEGDTL